MMKKLVIVIIALIGLYSCSTDLSGIEEKLAALENQGSSLDKKLKDLENKNNELNQESDALEAEVKRRQEENEKIRQQLLLLEDSLNTV